MTKLICNGLLLTALCIVLEVQGDGNTKKNYLRTNNPSFINDSSSSQALKSTSSPIDSLDYNSYLNGVNGKESFNFRPIKNSINSNNQRLETNWNKFPSKNQISKTSPFSAQTRKSQPAYQTPMTVFNNNFSNTRKFPGQMKFNDSGFQRFNSWSKNFNGLDSTDQYKNPTTPNIDKIENIGNTPADGTELNRLFSRSMFDNNQFNIKNQLFDHLKKLSPLVNQKSLQLTDMSDIDPDLMDIQTKTFDSDGLRGSMIVVSVKKCCIRGVCHTIQDGESCGEGEITLNTKNGIQQPIETSDQFDNFDISLGPKKYNKNSINQGSYPTNDGSTSSGFVGSSNGSDKNVKMFPQSPSSHKYVKPFGFTEAEAKKIRDQVLNKSNFYRKKYGMPELILDNQICNYSQDWANNLSETGMRHRPEQIYGENLYMSSNRPNIGDAAVESWFNEIVDYNPNQNTEEALYLNSPIHHLTQLLWKSSKKLGVGIAKNSEGNIFVVCNYDPSGNVGNYFKKNLPNISQDDINEVSENVQQLQNESQQDWNSMFQWPAY